VTVIRPIKLNEIEEHLRRLGAGNHSDNLISNRPTGHHLLLLTTCSYSPPAPTHHLLLPRSYPAPTPLLPRLLTLATNLSQASGTLLNQYLPGWNTLGFSLF